MGLQKWLNQMSDSLKRQLCSTYDQNGASRRQGRASSFSTDCIAS